MATNYFDEARPREILREYPLGDDFLAGPAQLSSDALHDLRQRRFLEVVARGWQVPFYQRHWRAAGLEPGDIRGLEDIGKIPAFSKNDLMASVAAAPPLGDYHGLELDADGRLIDPQGTVFHTTSGTTGTPQPLFFGAWDREVQNALLARTYLLHGLSNRDVVHSVYGFGMVNGGHYVREALLHFTKALLLSAGTGLETRSIQQIDLIKRFGVTVLVGFIDYLKKLAEVARDQGLEPGGDLPVRMISGHLGQENRENISELWGGPEVYDWYGVGDTGVIAAESATRNGLHIYEDAHLVEILDPDNGQPLPDGQDGNITDTVLFKNTVYPVIRFDTKDVSHILPADTSSAINFRRLAGFRGRSDNMVKLRGINVYPTAIGALLDELDGVSGEYVCKVREQSGREQMTVLVETTGAGAVTAETVAGHLRQKLGVEVGVELVPAGATASLTGIESRQKPTRLIDER